MSTTQDIINELKQELEAKIRQREGVLDQLKLADVTLDKMDDVIKKIDKDAQSKVDIINPTLTKVANAYKERITSGCRNDLEWVVTSSETRRSKAFSSDRTVTVYECKEIESLERQENYHALKFYSKPADMDYGSTLIGEFKGIATSGSTVLGIHSSTFEPINADVFDYPAFIKIGDSIIDNIENPEIFNAQDIPKVTGLGFTDYIGIVTTLTGGIDAGSNVFRHFGAGSLTDIETLFNAGERIGLNEPFVTGNTNPSDVFAVGFATVIGIGTATQIVDYQNQLGIPQQDEFDIQTLLLSENATQTVGEQEFTVGILTAIGCYFLDTTAKKTSGITSFFAIRQDEDPDSAFDFTANPHSPEKIGVLGSGNLGVGHSVFYVKNGDPSTQQRWRPETAHDEIKIRKRDNIPAVKEPKVGGGNAPYNLGNFQWPVKIVTQESSEPRGWDNETVTYAQKGDIVRVSSDDVGAGSTSGTSIGVGYRPTSPLTPSGSTCSNLDDAISEAEDKRDETVSKYEPEGRGIMALSSTLRENRAGKQLYAWSLLQASRSLRDDIEKLTKQIASLRNSDLSKYDK